MKGEPVVGAVQVCGACDAGGYLFLHASVTLDETPARTEEAQNQSSGRHSKTTGPHLQLESGVHI